MVGIKDKPIKFGQVGGIQIIGIVRVGNVNALLCDGLRQDRSIFF